jgi:drug/metabolite transporter (DMT)-like permease
LAGLILNPFLLASGTIAMRKMVNIHHFVVSSYLNFAIGIIGAIFSWLLGQSLAESVSEMSILSWLLVFMASALVMITQIAKFLAVQNYPAGKLQVFSYFMLPAQFIVDTTFFGVEFNRMQMVGLLIFIILYGIIFARFFLRPDLK